METLTQMQPEDWGLTPTEYARRDRERRRSRDRKRLARTLEAIRASRQALVVPGSRVKGARVVQGVSGSGRICMLMRADGPIPLPYVCIQFGGQG